MSFDQMMLRFGAPTICGIKPANLFSIKNELYSDRAFLEWKDALKKNRIHALRSQKENFSLVLVYNLDWIKEILQDKPAQKYLKQKGYANFFDCSGILRELDLRMRTQKNFPHEVGIFLGYPIADVIEFERSAGRGCKFCGVWKAYSDEARAKDYSVKARSCSNLCEKWFERGYSLSQIIKKYKKAQKAA